MTQILAQTGQSLLGMHIDLARSRKLTAQINRAPGNGQLAQMTRLQRHRAKIDDRFNQHLALAATVRYLRLAQQRFGRPDLAIESYHMGIGNLQHVLDLYDGGKPVPYMQLYFDTAPDHHSRRVQHAVGLRRRLVAVLLADPRRGADHAPVPLRPAVAEAPRLAADEHRISAAGAAPARRTRAFADPDALYHAYASKQLVPLPSNARALGLAYAPEHGLAGQERRREPGRCTGGCARPRSTCWSSLRRACGRCRAAPRRCSSTAR